MTVNELIAELANLNYDGKVGDYNITMTYEKIELGLDGIKNIDDYSKEVFLEGEE